MNEKRLFKWELFRFPGTKDSLNYDEVLFLGWGEMGYAVSVEDFYFICISVAQGNDVYSELSVFVVGVFVDKIFAKDFVYFFYKDFFFIFVEVSHEYGKLYSRETRLLTKVNDFISEFVVSYVEEE